MLSYDLAALLDSCGTSDRNLIQLLVSFPWICVLFFDDAAVMYGPNTEVNLKLFMPIFISYDDCLRLVTELLCMAYKLM